MPDENKKIPSPARLNRVLEVIENEEQFNGKLSKPTVEVTGRTGTKKYPVEVINIAVAMVDAGLDPALCKKVEVVTAALKILGSDAGPIMPASATVASSPKVGDDEGGDAGGDGEGGDEGGGEQPASQPESKGPELGTPGHSPVLAMLNLVLATSALAAYDKTSGYKRRSDLIAELKESLKRDLKN